MKLIVCAATILVCMPLLASNGETPPPHDACSVDKAIEFVCDEATISAKIDMLWTAFKIKSASPSKLGARPRFSFILSATPRIEKDRRLECETKAPYEEVVVYATPEEMVRFLGGEEGFVSCVIIRELLFVHGRRVGTLTPDKEKMMRERATCP